MVPALFLYWSLIHGFIRFWRRLGPRRTLVIVWTGMALVACVIFQLRGRLVTGDFGTNWPLVAAGFVCLGVAGRVRMLLHRQITTHFLLGVPELEPDGRGQALVREGLYAHVRHPRYLQMILALLGWSLIANYLTAYVAWLLWIVAVCLIVPLEERELRGRFGADYEQYIREVPRFIPRRKR
jgi:protein-S-isoprenylcysteine O-methyltransferase Ste14